MEKNELCRLWMAQLAAVMPRTQRLILASCGSAEEAWKRRKELEGIPGIQPADLEELRAAVLRGLPAEMAEHMKKIGMKSLSIEEEAYPLRLRELEAAPYMVFYRGELPTEETAAVAVVGARNCSDYGRRTAVRLGRELAASGVAVVSGMARGIDGLSQEACLDGGGKSYAILGCGADVIYPNCNRTLYRKLTEHGGVLSEYPPGSEALPFHFPQRNRLISAFSDLLLVVEAREKSGSFITVNYALEQGKEVYAVPGRIEDPLSFGCNRLIAQAGMDGEA
ncbi:MAG: DNA-processing protein DprA [Lachnospiraceae bacterium]|nr:DNA-processing protein DprA [Lachnospiraceae bacterium]